MNRKELIDRYLKFFESKNHKKIPNSKLIPENDPTTLFISAGMQPLISYFLNQKHPLGKRLTNVQRCVRTGDIEEVGDSYHHTFFEMLGNWSFGDYFKEDSIKFSFEFLTKVLKIPKEKLAISCFEGDKTVERDEESKKIWISLGIPKERIIFLGRKENWWGPAGKTGPCGPDTEIFYWRSFNESPPEKFNPNDKRWVEIWNNVFIEYNKNSKGKYERISKRSVDTGMGVERTVSILNHLEDDYLTDCFEKIIKKIENLSNKKYGESEEETRAMRIIADHLKSSVFMIYDGVKPSNTEQGYILRRLIRRVIRYGAKLKIDNVTQKVADSIFLTYRDYENLNEMKKIIIEELKKEEEKFKETLEKGLIIFNKIIKNKNTINGKDAFLLYQSYGFPIEMTQELAEEKKVKIDSNKLKKIFEEEKNKHQALSRISSGEKFKSGLADESESTKKLHTATHLLNESIRRILKNKDIKQKGSNISSERLRFDFSFERKLTEEEIKEIENLVNMKIKQSLKVVTEEKKLEDAIKEGAQSEFGNKYPEIVSVYTILDPSERKGWFSKEICTGPHLKNTKEIGNIKIIKEESSSAGVRRIKAILENSFDGSK